MSTTEEKLSDRKTTGKTKTDRLRARAEAALADVRRRAECLSGPRRKR